MVNTDELEAGKPSLQSDSRGGTIELGQVQQLRITRALRDPGGNPKRAFFLPGFPNLTIDLRDRVHAMEIDWSKAPKNARWWAVDANGYASWFGAPNVAPFTDFWFCEPTPAPTFGFDGDWRESLTERP